MQTRRTGLMMIRISVGRSRNHQGKPEVRCANLSSRQLLARCLGHLTEQTGSQMRKSIKQIAQGSASRCDRRSAIFYPVSVGLSYYSSVDRLLTINSFILYFSVRILCVIYLCSFTLQDVFRMLPGACLSVVLLIRFVYTGFNIKLGRIF